MVFFPEFIEFIVLDIDWNPPRTRGLMGDKAFAVQYMSWSKAVGMIHLSLPIPELSRPPFRLVTATQLTTHSIERSRLCWEPVIRHENDTKRQKNVLSRRCTYKPPVLSMALEITDQLLLQPHPPDKLSSKAFAIRPNSHKPQAHAYAFPPAHCSWQRTSTQLVTSAWSTVPR